MTNPAHDLDPSFLVIQRARLVALCSELSNIMHRESEDARATDHCDRSSARQAR